MYNRILVIVIFFFSTCVPVWPQAQHGPRRVEAEYYIAEYGQHYQVPVALIRAFVERESNGRACAVSRKGAVGLMQLMPLTAQRLQVRDRCDIEQSISGGVRYLAWLCRIFHSDYRLVAAAYYAGEEVVARRGLAYHNPDVVAYVAAIRNAYLRQTPLETDSYVEVFR